MKYVSKNKKSYCIFSSPVSCWGEYKWRAMDRNQGVFSRLWHHLHLQSVSRLSYSLRYIFIQHCSNWFHAILMFWQQILWPSLLVDEPLLDRQDDALHAYDDPPDGPPLLCCPERCAQVCIGDLVVSIEKLKLQLRNELYRLLTE